MQILLSIKPEFAEKILQGEKEFEFRKILFKTPSVTKILIYASTPVQKIIGEFEIDYILSKSIGKLWEMTMHQAGIEKDYFDQYFGEREIGHAIKIKNAKRYSEPLELKELEIRRPPQSFLYL